MRYDNSVLDAALQVIRDTANEMHITSAEATTFTEATNTLSLGSKATPTISAQEAPPTGTGRQARIASFADGTTAADGTAPHWALVDTVGRVVLATGSFSNGQVVTTGNPWGLNADQPLIIRQPA